MQGVILAAGKGSRLHPLTLARSKAMIPILGKPIVERVLETFVENGVDEVLMVVSQEDSEIRRHFQERCRLPVKITFVVQPERLGMANALSLAAPLIHGPFILSACDNLTPAEHVAELMHVHARESAAATLSLMKIDPALVSRTGIVELANGRVRRIVEKPRLEEAPSNISSLPLYVFSERIMEALPEVRPRRGEYELQDAIQMLIDSTGQGDGRLHRAPAAIDERRRSPRAEPALLERGRRYPAARAAHGGQAYASDHAAAHRRRDDDRERLRDRPARLYRGGLPYRQPCVDCGRGDSARVRDRGRSAGGRRGCVLS